MADYDELSKLVRRGDREAAEALLPLARAKRDHTTLLYCWRVLWSPRFNAWSALSTSLDAAGWRGMVNSSAATTFDRFTTTDSIRAEVVAQALVEACRTIDREAAPVAGALADLATRILKGGKVKTRHGVGFQMQEFLTAVDAVPFQDGNEKLLLEIARANEMLDTIFESLDAHNSKG